MKMYIFSISMFELKKIIINLKNKIFEYVEYLTNTESFNLVQ